MSNTVAIKIYDKQKSLRFSETLTTGSRYLVQVEGGAGTCGADAALILSTPSGLQMAVAALVDGEGTLDLNCDAVLKMERTVPFGTVFTLNAVLRSFDEGAERNVGIGCCQIVAAWQGRENADTGTVVYYKGAKGDPMRWDEMGESDKAALVDRLADGSDLAERIADKITTADEVLDGMEIKTNTLAHIRDAVKTIAVKLGARKVSAILLALGAALLAHGAGMQKLPLAALNLDDAPEVVVDVDLGGLAATEDVAKVAGDLAAYTNAADAAMHNLRTNLEWRIDAASRQATNYTDSAALAALETVRTQAERLAAMLRGEMSAIAADVPQTVTNLVEDVLAPRTLEFHYGDGAITNAFVAPQFATSKLSFVLDGAEDDLLGMPTANMYSTGRLRNYSVLIDEIPATRKHLTISFYALAETHAIYAQPKLYTSREEKIPGTTDYLPLSWDLYTNDVPCVVTIREPEAGTLVIRRDRLGDDEIRTYLKNEDGKTYIYER